MSKYGNATPEQGAGQFKRQGSGVIPVELVNIILTEKPNSTEQILFVFKNIDNGNEFTSDYITVINSDGKTLNQIGITQVNRVLAILGIKSLGDVEFIVDNEKSTNEKLVKTANGVKGKKFKIAFAVTLGDSEWNGKVKHKKVILDTFSIESNKSAYEIANGKEAKSIDTYKDLKDTCGPYWKEGENSSKSTQTKDEDVDAALGLGDEDEIPV